jgi:hypothetical protein
MKDWAHPVLSFRLVLWYILVLIKTCNLFAYSVREPPSRGNVYDNTKGRLGIHHLQASRVALLTSPRIILLSICLDVISREAQRASNIPFKHTSCPKFTNKIRQMIYIYIYINLKMISKQNHRMLPNHTIYIYIN